MHSIELIEGMVMHCFFRFIPILVGSILVTVSTLNAEAASSESYSSLVDAVLARSECIFSGEFKVVFSTGIGADSKSRASRGPYIYTFSGSDWARRFPWTSADRIVNRDQRKMQLWTNPGGKEFGAELGPPVSARKVCGDSSPLFVGTFWHELTLRWIQEHRSDVVHVGNELIDDVDTEILEWKLAPEDSFKLVPEENNLTLNKAGVLRLYAAPKFGYALPRIDRLTEDGTLAFRVESVDFRSIGDQIWAPFRCRWQWFDPKPAFYEEYDLIEVAKINEPIPEQEFQFQVPAGTLLADRRDESREVILDIGLLSDEARIEQLITDAKAAKPSRAFDRVTYGISTPRLAIIIANVSAFLIFVGIVFYRRLAQDRV